MNRLSPLVVRRAAPAAAAVATKSFADHAFEGGDRGRALEDLKLFATGWLGGLVFFGTLFG